MTNMPNWLRWIISPFVFIALLITLLIALIIIGIKLMTENEDETTDEMGGVSPYG